MSKQNIFLTVDAVVFCKDEKQKFLLLVQRKNEPYKEEWALPGGYVESDEGHRNSSFAGAKRRDRCSIVVL